MAWGTGPPRVVAEVFMAGIAPRGMAYALVGGGDCSCERATCRARRCLVEGGSSSRELVGEALN
jgi:hypothetical protein